jgi:hypothetical protein
MRKILYTVDSPQRFITALLHRITVEAESSADLLYIPIYFKDSEMNMEKLVSAQLFNRVIPYNPNVLNRIIKGNSDFLVIEKMLIEYYDHYFEVNQVNIARYEAIFAFEHKQFDLACYFNLRHIHHYLAEGGENELGARLRKQRRKVLNSQDFVSVYKFAFQNEKVQQLLMWETSVLSIKYCKSHSIPVTTVDYVSLYNKVPEMYSVRCNDYFDILLSDEIISNKVLLLPNSPLFAGRQGILSEGLSVCDKLLYRDFLFGNKSQIDEKFATYCDLIALSYYADSEEEVLLKRHPTVNYTQKRINELYGANVSSVGNMPMQIWKPFLDRNCLVFKTLLTYSSTANIFQPKAKTVVQLGRSFVTRLYWKYNLIYTSAVVSDLFSRKMMKYSQDESVMAHINYLFDYSLKKDSVKFELNKNSEIKANSFILLYKIEASEIEAYKIVVNNIDEESVLCFIEVADLIKLYNSDIFDLVIPIKVNKCALGNTIDPLNSEILYFVTKNYEKRMQIRNFTLNKTLKFLNIKLSVDRLTSIEVSEILLKLFETLNYGSSVTDDLCYSR